MLWLKAVVQGAFFQEPVQLLLTSPLGAVGTAMHMVCCFMPPPLFFMPEQQFVQF